MAINRVKSTLINSVIPRDSEYCFPTVTVWLAYLYLKLQNSISKLCNRSSCPLVGKFQRFFIFSLCTPGPYVVSDLMFAFDILGMPIDQAYQQGSIVTPKVPVDWLVFQNFSSNLAINAISDISVISVIFLWSLSLPGSRMGMMHTNFYTLGIMSVSSNKFRRSVGYCIALRPKFLSIVGVIFSGPKALDVLVFLSLASASTSVLWCFF